MTFNIQNASIINVEGHRTHKNCKAVYCITTGEVFASVADAAERYGIAQSTLSWALTGKTNRCQGKRFCFVANIVEHLDEIALNNRAREAKVIAHDRMVAKQEKMREIKARIGKHDSRIAELQAELDSEMALKADAAFELKALEEHN